MLLVIGWTLVIKDNYMYELLVLVNVLTFTFFYLTINVQSNTYKSERNQLTLLDFRYLAYMLENLSKLVA